VVRGGKERTFVRCLLYGGIGLRFGLLGGSYLGSLRLLGQLYPHVLGARNSHIELSEHGLVNTTIRVIVQNNTKRRSITFRGVIGYF
jgi:hypothetical protein